MSGFIPNGESISILGIILDFLYSIYERVKRRLIKVEPISLYGIMLERIQSEIELKRLMTEKGFTFK